MAEFAMTKLDKKRNISQVTYNVSMPGTLYSTFKSRKFSSRCITFVKVTTSMYKKLSPRTSTISKKGDKRIDVTIWM